MLRGRRRYISAIAGVLLMMVSSATAAARFDRLVVFGDSLSDIGNAGRFSNGPVWVEHLAQTLGVELQPSEQGGTNYAVGGARLDPASGSSSLRGQVDRFLASGHTPAGALVIVFGGGNDLLAAAGHPEPRSLITSAVVSFASIIDDLIARGARDLLVPNLPDVGMTPAVQSYGPQAAILARQLTSRFNAEVDAVVASRGAMSDVRIHRLDIWQLAERVRAAPQEFGFRDVATPCSGGECRGYLFWDSVHPTAPAHQRLGAAALQLLAAER